MNLKDFKSCIDQAFKKAGKVAATADVEVWIKDKKYKIKDITQFSIKPDLMITIEKDASWK